MSNKKKWRKVRLSATEIGIRDNGGFICTLKHPTHFSGQDERYEEELKERLFQADIIAAAPEMYDLLQRIMSIRSLWYPSDNYPENEAQALSLMDSEIKELLKHINNEQ